MKESAAFGWVGKVSAFVPGEKSPVQYLSMQVVATDVGTTPEIDPAQEYAVSLSKSIRQMMLGYLAPDDWIRVVGKRKFDGKTGDWQWKAREIVKLSADQIGDYRKSVEKSTDPDSTRLGTGQPALQKTSGKASGKTRVLICQKSSCQRRGSMAVCQAIERAIAQSNHPHDVILQATGCMKQCKSGPHVVLQSSNNKHKQRETKRYANITPKAAYKIIEQML